MAGRPRRSRSAGLWGRGGCRSSCRSRRESREDTARAGKTRVKRRPASVRTACMAHLPHCPVHSTNGRPAMKKSASATWSGGLKDGQGTISTETGVLREAPFGFKSRFEDGPGTNPEELIGAALAGCFSMALSLGLGNAGLTAEKIDTHTQVTLDKQGEGFAITTIALTCRARVPGADADTFSRIAQETKQGCPVSKVLRADISLDASLES